jgi:hypothetical protein
LGGEIIRLQVDSKDIIRTVEFLASLRMVKSVERVDSQRGGLSVLVKDAGKTFPVLLAALKENLGITPKHAEPYLPPFDEVFIRIIQRAETGRPATTRRRKSTARKQAALPILPAGEAGSKAAKPEASESQRIAVDRIVEDAVVKDPGVEAEDAKLTVQVAVEQKEDPAAEKEREANIEREEAERRQ